MSNSIQYIYDPYSGQMRALLKGPQSASGQAADANDALNKELNNALGKYSDLYGQVNYLIDTSDQWRGKGLDVTKTISNILSSAEPKERAKFLGDENNLKTLVDNGFNRESLKKQKIDAENVSPIKEKLDNAIKTFNGNNQRIFDYLKTKNDGEYHKLAKEKGGGAPKEISDIYKRYMNVYELQAEMDRSCPDPDDIDGRIGYLLTNRELWNKKDINVNSMILGLEMSRPRTSAEKIAWLKNDNNRKDLPGIDMDKEIENIYSDDIRLLLAGFLEEQNYEGARNYVKENAGKVKYEGETLETAHLLSIIELKEMMDNGRIDDAKALCEKKKAAFYGVKGLFSIIFDVASFEEFVKQINDNKNIYFSCVLPAARRPALAPNPDPQMKMSGHLDADHIAELQAMLQAVKGKNGDTFLDPSHSINGELDLQTAVALAGFMNRNAPAKTVSYDQNEYLMERSAAKRASFKWGEEQTKELQGEYQAAAGSALNAPRNKLSALLTATKLGFALKRAGVLDKTLLSAIVEYIKTKDVRTINVYDELSQFIAAPPKDEISKSRFALLLSVVISKCSQDAYVKGKEKDIRSFVNTKRAGLAEFPDHMVSWDAKVKQITAVLDECEYSDKVVDLRKMSPVDAMLRYPIANFLLQSGLGAASASNIDLTPQLLRQWADMASRDYGYYLKLDDKDIVLEDVLAKLMYSSGRQELKDIFGTDAPKFTAVLSKIKDYNDKLQREKGIRLELLPEEMGLLRKYLDDPKIKGKAAAENQNEKEMYWKVYSLSVSFANTALITTEQQKELAALAKTLEHEGKNLTYKDIVEMKGSSQALKTLYYNIETAKSYVQDTKAFWKSPMEMLSIPLPTAGSHQVLALRAEYARRPGGEAERIRFLKTEIERIENKLAAEPGKISENIPLLPLKNSYLAELKALANALFSTRITPDLYEWIVQKYISRGANSIAAGMNSYLAGANYYDLVDGEQKNIEQAFNIIKNNLQVVKENGGIYSLDINAGDTQDMIQAKQALSFFTVLAVDQEGKAKGNVNVQSMKSLGGSLLGGYISSQEEDIKQLCFSLYGALSDEDLGSYVNFILDGSGENYNKINKFDIRVLIKVLESIELPEEYKDVVNSLRKALKDGANWDGNVLKGPFFSSLFSKDTDLYEFLKGETQPTVVGAADAGKIAVNNDDTILEHYFWMADPKFYKQVLEQFEYARDVKKENVKDLDQLLKQFFTQEVTMRTMMPVLIYAGMPLQTAKTYYKRGFVEGSKELGKTALMLMLYPRFLPLWYRRLGEELKQGNYATALALYYALNYLTFRGGWNSVAARTIQPLVELKSILSKVPGLERYVKDPNNKLFSWMKDTGLIRRKMQPRLNSIRERMEGSNKAVRIAAKTAEAIGFNPWKVGGEGFTALAGIKVTSKGKAIPGRGMNAASTGYNVILDIPSYAIDLAVNEPSGLVRRAGEKSKAKKEASRYNEADRPYVEQVLLKKGYLDINGAGSFAEVEIRGGEFISTGKGAVPNIISLIGELKTTELPKLAAVFNGEEVKDIPIVRVQRNKGVSRPFILYNELTAGAYEATLVLPEKLPLAQALKQVGKLKNKEVTMPADLFKVSKLELGTLENKIKAATIDLSAEQGYIARAAQVQKRARQIVQGIANKAGTGKYSAGAKGLVIKEFAGMEAKYAKGEILLDEYVAWETARIEIVSGNKDPKKIVKMDASQIKAIMSLCESENGLLNLKPGGGKTLTGYSAVRAMSALGKHVHILVPGKDLLTQYRQDLIDQFGIDKNEIGVIREDMSREAKLVEYAKKIVLGADALIFDSISGEFMDSEIRRSVLMVEEYDARFIDFALNAFNIAGYNEPGRSALRAWYEDNMRYNGKFKAARKQLLNSYDNKLIDQYFKGGKLTLEGVKAFGITGDIEAINMYEKLFFAKELKDARERFKRTGKIDPVHGEMLKDYQYKIDWVNREIEIITRSSGEAAKGSHWENMIHEAIAVMNDLPARKGQETIASIAFRDFLDLYGSKLGVSGTTNKELISYVYGGKIPLTFIDAGTFVPEIEVTDTDLKDGKLRPEKMDAIRKAINLSVENNPSYEGKIKAKIIDRCSDERGKEAVEDLNRALRGDGILVSRVRYETPRLSMARGASIWAVAQDAVDRMTGQNGKSRKTVLVHAETIQEAEQLKEAITAVIKSRGDIDPALKDRVRTVSADNYSSKWAAYIKKYAGKEGKGGWDILIATNMGRGTNLAPSQIQQLRSVLSDISKTLSQGIDEHIRAGRLDEAAKILNDGGLHVIAPELSEPRSQKQKLDRMGRYLDPGSASQYWSLDDVTFNSLDEGQKKAMEASFIDILKGKQQKLLQSLPQELRAEFNAKLKEIENDRPEQKYVRPMDDPRTISLYGEIEQRLEANVTPEQKLLLRDLYLRSFDLPPEIMKKFRPADSQMSFIDIAIEEKLKKYIASLSQTTELGAIDNEAKKELSAFRGNLSNQQVRDIVIGPMIENIFEDLKLTGGNISDIKTLEKLQDRVERVFGETADLSAVSGVIKRGEAVDPRALRAALTEKLYALFVSRYPHEIEHGINQSMEKRDRFMKRIMSVIEQVNNRLERSLGEARRLMVGAAFSTEAGLDKRAYIEYYRSLTSECKKDAMSFLRAKIADVVFFNNKLTRPFRMAFKVGANKEIVISEKDIRAVSKAEVKENIPEVVTERSGRKVAEPVRIPGPTGLVPVYGYDGTPEKPDESKPAGRTFEKVHDLGVKAYDLGAKAYRFAPVHSGVAGFGAGIISYPVRLAFNGKLDEFNMGAWGKEGVSSAWGWTIFGFKTWGLEKFAGFVAKSTMPIIIAADQLAALALAEPEKKGEQAIVGGTSLTAFFVGMHYGGKLVNKMPTLPGWKGKIITGGVKITVPLMTGIVASQIGESGAQAFIDRNLLWMNTIAYNPVTQGIGSVFSPLGMATPGYWWKKEVEPRWQPETISGKVAKLGTEAAADVVITVAEAKLAKKAIVYTATKLLPALGLRGVLSLAGPASALLFMSDTPRPRYWISAGSSGELALNELAKGKVLSSMDKIAREKYKLPDCHEISLADKQGRWSMDKMINEGKETTSLAWESAVALAKLGYIRKDMMKGISEEEQKQLMGAINNIDFSDLASTQRAFNAYSDFLKPSEWVLWGDSKGHKSEAFKALLAEAVIKFQQDMVKAKASGIDKDLISEADSSVLGPATARWIIAKYLEK